jgi:hypothetical protein
VADAEYDVVRTVVRQQAQLVEQERLPGDREQRLRRLAGEIAQPAPAATGEDADLRQLGQPAYASSTRAQA